MLSLPDPCPPPRRSAPRALATELRLDPARPGFRRVRRFGGVLRTAIFASTLSLGLGLAGAAYAVEFTVTNANDSGAGSLRQAVLDANGNATADNIVFDASVAGMTITLTTGDIAILNQDLEIDGEGQGITISGNDSSRIFTIDDADDDFTVTLRGLTLTDGNEPADDGGAIFSSESLVIEDSTITASEAEVGGGIYSDGPELTILRSTVSGNDATDGRGGGIYFPGDELTIRDTTISGNTATEPGGGLYSSGDPALIVNSTISGNESEGKGGGVANSGGGEMTILNSTITGNTADEGGGLYADNDVTVRNTIIADNTALDRYPDVYDATGVPGTAVTGSFNLIGDAAGSSFVGGVSGNIVGVSANLGPLADNGGPTLTHLPNPGSPAIDNGDPGFPQPGPPPAGDVPLANDQRLDGFPRVVNGRIDIGAVEAMPLATRREGCGGNV